MTEPAPPPRPTVQQLSQVIKTACIKNFDRKKTLGRIAPPKLGVDIDVGAIDPEPGDPVHTVRLNARVRAYRADTDAPLFEIAVDMVGRFQMENVPVEQVHAFQRITCPTSMYPSLRALVSTLSADAGFPPVNLQVIDFMDIYRQKLAAREAELAKQLPPD